MLELSRCHWFDNEARAIDFIKANRELSFYFSPSDGPIFTIFSYSTSGPQVIGYCVYEGLPN